jgi:regulator of sirC expression with transglutaminase-like and TPR domain
MTTPPESHTIPNRARQLARTEFVSLVTRNPDEIPLLEAAAWICAEERGVATIEPIIHAVDDLSTGLFIPEDITLVERIARLNHHLFVDLQFKGDEDNFDDPENSMLDAVIKNRQGLPILLSVLMMSTAERVGISLHGIGFPTHFLVSPEGALPRFFIDPFNRGEILRLDQLERWFDKISDRSHDRLPPFSWWLKPVSTRHILARINNNLKGSYLRRDDLKGALRCVERLLILTPEAIEARRDRGLLRFELGQEEEGAKDLDAYLAARHLEGLPTD